MGLRQLAYNTTATILSRIIPARGLIVSSDTLRLFLGTGTSTPKEIAFKTDVPGLPVIFQIADTAGTQSMTGNFAVTPASFTAGRTLALPLAAGFEEGLEVCIADLNGALSSSAPLTVTHSGGNTINGGASYQISEARAVVRFISDGSDGWHVDPRLSVKVSGPGSSTTGRVPQWSDATGFALGAGLPVGGNNGLLQLDSSGAIPSSYLSSLSASVSTVASDVANRLRFDAAQSLTSSQLSQVLANIGDAFAAPGEIAVNYQLSPSVASNALTVAILTRAGGVPAAADPVKLSFRNASWSSGQWAARTVSGALSLVIPSGATLGHLSGVIGSLYWYALDNGGTVELAVAGSFLGNDGIVSTTAISSAASSSSTMYSANARTGIPYILLGRTADTQTAAGTWAAAPSHIQAARRLESIRNAGYAESTANALLTATIGFSDTIPQNTAGTQILSLPVTPSWPANRMRVTARGYGGQNGSFGLVAAIFSSLSTNALDANWFVTNGAGYRSTFSCQAEHAPATASAITYSLRVGPAAGGSGAVLNGTYNGTVVSRDFGGAARTTMIVEEITA